MVKSRDHSQLLGQLYEEYAAHSPVSCRLHQRAKEVMPDGGNHAGRLMQPFPPRIRVAQGAWLQDEDGHKILDLWQGHFANIVGHNPEPVCRALSADFAARTGLQTGFTEALHIDVAELLLPRVGAERVRFTTSGALATMYSIMLGRAYTGRNLVMKAGGGWHGAQPWALKGIGFAGAPDAIWHRVESEGLPATFPAEVVVTDYNDTERLSDHFRQYGDQLACFIVEPFIGAGGCLPAKKEYLLAARDLCTRYGVVLIFDEVISGFRFRAGDAGGMYGIRPDLATFGKIIGGGMPVSAVAGRGDILGLVEQAKGQRVKFYGGTYSAHPASMRAAKIMLTYLVENESEIYPHLTEMGERIRESVERIFAQHGIYARCTGQGNEALPGSSVSMLVFPYSPGLAVDQPRYVRHPDYCDHDLCEKVLPVAMLLEDVYVVHGMGGLSTAHSTDEIDVLCQAYERVARRLKAYL